MADTDFGGATIVVKGTTFKSAGMGATYSGTIEIDQTKKPKRFDLVFTAGPEKGNRNLGIYTLGREKWTICFATRGSNRPETFATRAGTGFALETLERGDIARKTTKETSPRTRASGKSPKQTAAERDALSSPETELEGEWAMVTGVLDGVALDKDAVTWCKRITRGHLTTVVAGPQVFLKASFTLDQSKTPHAIDYVNLGGAGAAKPQAGIFDLKGNTLKVCMAAPGRPRPADFSSTSGDGRSLTTWRLIKTT